MRTGGPRPSPTNLMGIISGSEIDEDRIRRSLAFIGRIFEIAGDVRTYGREMEFYKRAVGDVRPYEIEMECPERAGDVRPERSEEVPLG